MTKRHAIRVVLTAILIGMIAAALVVYTAYRRDLNAAVARTKKSQTIQTPCGLIEYASVGIGSPVLVVHGAGGGFDQGLDFAAPLTERGFRVIAMSRFGYLRTPLPKDASPSAQADAHACLLDALNLKSAAIIGASAGAPSAMQFALRHPDRCSALLLIVPAGYVPRASGAPPLKTPEGTEFLFGTALRSDFLFWIGPRVAHDVFAQAILATPPDVLKRASSSEQARANSVIEHILPVSARRAGLLNDAIITQSLPRYELENIRARTLIVSVEDDLFGTYEVARYTSEHIPGARFVGYDSGGHLWIGHQQELLSAIAQFLY